MDEVPLIPPDQQRSRLSAIHSNVRNMLRNSISSSIYSRPQRTSALPTPTVPEMPQLPQLAFLRGVTGAQQQAAQATQHSTSQDQQSGWSSFSSSTGTLEGDEETEKESTEDLELGLQPPIHRTREPVVSRETSARRHHRRKRKYAHQRQGAWVKRKQGHSRGLWHGRTRMKCFGALVSAFLIAVLLAIYLGLALTLPHVSQGVHIIFILSILAATMFFAHCLIRLCMLARQGPVQRRKRRRVRGICGPDGFHPSEAMRVHVAADEEALIGLERDRGHLDGDRAAGEGTDGKPKRVKVPPPAYGLWRSSVRANPNLLHWARVEQPQSPDKTLPVSPSSAGGSVRGPEMQQREPEITVPRPPSYVSDDGVAYVVHPVPRSTVVVPDLRPPSRLHPALRSLRGSTTAESEVEEMTIPVGLGLDEIIR